MAVNYGYFATPYGAVTQGMPASVGAFPMVATPAYSQLPASFGAMIQSGMPFLGASPMPQAYGAIPMGYSPMQSMPYATGMTAFPAVAQPSYSQVPVLQGSMPYLSPNVMMGAQSYAPLMQGVMPYLGGTAMPGVQGQLPTQGGVNPAALTQPFEGALQNFGQCTINNYFGGIPNTGGLQSMPPQQAMPPAGTPNPQQQAGNVPNAQGQQVMGLLTQMMDMIKGLLGTLLSQQQSIPSTPPMGQPTQSGPCSGGPVQNMPAPSRKGGCRGKGKRFSRGRHHSWGKHHSFKAQRTMGFRGVQS
jgi:hypothetical protein